MSCIAFFSIPAYGHTNPTLGVVKELTARGHQVWYYSFRAFQEKIEAAGAAFVECNHGELGMKEQQGDADRVGKDIVFSTQLIVNSTLAMDDWITGEMKKLQPDVIVGDSMAYWAKLSAQKLNIPFVSSTTTFAFNRYSSAIMQEQKPGLGDLFRMMVQMGKTARLLQPLRDKGYPIKNILDIIQNDNDTNTIVYTSKLFQPCADTFSDKYHFVGPSIRPAETEIQKTAPKLVYISMGTVNNDLKEFYRSCIDGLRDSEYQVILSVGERVDAGILGPLSDHISVFSHVDQMAVLRQADVFLSHCGMNSANEALYHGVPLVTCPQTPEQVGVARRVEQMEAGLRLQQTDAAAIREAIDRVLCDDSFRQKARHISQSFQKCGGAAEAADVILQAART